MDYIHKLQFENTLNKSNFLVMWRGKTANRQQLVYDDLHLRLNFTTQSRLSMILKKKSYENMWEKEKCW